MAKHEPLMIDSVRPPKVLLLGNGMLKLCGGSDWMELLKKISKDAQEVDLSGIPYAMRPEVICGVDVEEVQRRTAEMIQNSPAHDLLKTLLRLDFDAILTTNYTYEIEEVLSGCAWTEYRRQRAFFALDGNPRARDNTCACNMVERQGRGRIPVFHIHGEKGRKHSLVLGYYSYARSVAKLTEFSRGRGNMYAEHQQENMAIEAKSWLDYFLMGDVYAVGLGFDTSEFDLWWAAERKARENARHGTLRVFVTEKAGNKLPQEVLLHAMKAEHRRIDVYNGVYEPAYEKAVEQIVREMTRAE